MFFNYTSHSFHTAVTYLNSVLVKNFVKFVVFWGNVSEVGEECFSDVCLHTFTVWWVEPNDFSFSVRFLFHIFVFSFHGVSKIFSVASSSQCLLVVRFCFFKNFFVA